MYSLFNMPHHNSTDRILQSLIIPRHQPFIAISSSTFTTTQPSCWRSGEFQQFSQVLLQNRHPDLSIYASLCSFATFSLALLPNLLLVQTSPWSFTPSSWSCKLSLPFRPSPTLPAIVPSTSPHQCSSTPHHHLRCLTLVLHITHTQRKAPHVFFAAIMERFPQQN